MKMKCKLSQTEKLKELNTSRPVSQELFKEFL